MIRFVNHPAGLLVLRFDREDIEAIKPLSPLLHHHLADALVRADVLTAENGITKAVKIAVTAQLTDGHRLCGGQEPDTFELECSGSEIIRKDQDGLMVENLRASIELGALVLKETKASRRISFTPSRTNSTSEDLILDRIDEGPVTSEELVLALPAIPPSIVRGILERLIQNSRVLQNDGILSLADSEYEDDEEAEAHAEAKAEPEAEPEEAVRPTRKPTARQLIRAVFAAHDRETSISAEFLLQETGLTPLKLTRTLNREVLALRLFQEGKAYRIPTHAARSHLGNRIVELLAQSTTQFKKAGLTAAEIRRGLPEFAPAWIDRMLENMVVRKQISQQADVYLFNEPDVANRGSGFNRIRAAVKQAGDAGLTPRQVMDLLPEIKPALIHWNLQQLARRGLARFENNRFSWIGPKPAEPRVSFRSELLDYIKSFGDEPVPRDTIMAHFNHLPRVKVTVGLSELQNRGYVLFRSNCYRLREKAWDEVKASASATP